MMNVNVAGVMQIARAAVPAIVERGGGAIVTVSSVAGIRSSQEIFCVYYEQTRPHRPDEDPGM